METKPQLMLAALKLFAERGYDNVTIDDIAQATGNTKGAVYHYFSSKKGLYRDALRHIAGTLSRQALQDLRQTDTIPALFRHALMAGAGLLSNPQPLTHSDLHYLFLDGRRRFPELKDDIQALFSQYLDHTAEMIKNLDPNVDARALALLLLSGMEGLGLMRAMAGPIISEQDIDHIVAQMVG